MKRKATAITLATLMGTSAILNGVQNTVFAQEDTEIVNEAMEESANETMESEEDTSIDESTDVEIEEASPLTENSVSDEQPITSEEENLTSETRATEESAFTFTETTSSITITGYDVSIGGTDVVIPTMINDKPVKNIKDGAFQSKNLTSVVFPEGLETIGKYAFRNNAISNLTLPNSLKSIGWEGFVNAGIQTLTLPETMTTVPATSFGRNPIESLTIPDSVTNIDDNAFQGCSIKTINWGSGIKRIGINAFNGNKITNLNVTAETIENGAFYDNPLESVTLADSVRTVGGNAFIRKSNNKTLKNIDLGNGVEKIGNYAFEYGVVERIQLPSSLKEVGSGVFAYQELPYIELNATNPKVSYGNQRLSPRKVNKKQQDTTVTVNLAEMYEGIDTSKVRIDKIYSGVSSRELLFDYDENTGKLTIDDVAVSYVRLYYSYLSGSDVVLTVEQRLVFTNILTVKWNDYDDSNIQTDTYYRDYGTGYVTVTEAPRPVRDGYTFSHWLKDPFFVNHSLLEIEWSTTYKASYTENDYKIAYNLDYETEETITEKNVKWTTTGINAPTPRRENYIFDGWYYDNKKVENTDSVSSIVTQDPGNNSTITLTAKWRRPASVPVITANNVTLTVGDSFDPIKDTNVSAYDDIDGTIAVTEDNIIFNDVNPDVAGTYHVTFEVQNNDGAIASKTITVVVNPKLEVINHVPVINATDKVLTVGDTFNPLDGVTAHDTEDGDITLTEANIIANDVDMNQAGTYSITYKVTDSKGASALKTITVVVNPKMEELNHVPFINATDKVLTVGDTFNPLDGVTAHDTEDGDITLTEANIIANNVDMSKAGIYSITYKVTDSKGASTVKTITVTVNEKATIPVEKPENKPTEKPSQGGNNNTTTSKPDKLPQTGDASNLGLLGLMFAGSGGMLLGLNRKKRKK